MKVLNFGSLNYDHVYEVDHFTKEGETQSSLSYNRNFGGKGLNQSIALAKAGCQIYHAGKVGSDGQDFIDYLKSYNVKTDYLLKDNNKATGHAIIEISKGQNRIILYGGTNQEIDNKQIDDTLKNFEKGDYLLLQNEISSMSYLIKKGHELGLKIVFNTAPMNAKVFTYPLDLIDIFIVNEIEAQGLADSNRSDYIEIIKTLANKYPYSQIVMTVGSKGSYYAYKDNLIYQEAYKTKVVDSTAAGDTFTGYFLAGLIENKDIKEVLKMASKAASITVSKKGAAKSIPTIGEINEIY